MEHILDLLLGPAGVTVLVLVILWSGAKRHWVFGWAYRDAVHEKDEWKEAALRGTRVAERAVTIHESQQRRQEETDAGP